ncbi:hypothetical protein [Bradyrhizobium embrapense]|uniref:thiosulfate dehydrogenase n=1 Tax=Bradyrhizobium embrapense TaxID=630921 RepID=UPI00067D336F|nr:hypothetical protein [Bradyrhizobium embrapense]
MSFALNYLNRRAALGLFSQAALLTVARKADASGNQELDADLELFKQRLASAPRRRSFGSVPLVVTSVEQWDHEAASILLSYGNRARQVWECTELGAPWLNLMREALNGQVFAHGNPGFLAAGAVHGSAHLALFDQTAWERHGLARLAGGVATTNSYFESRRKTSRSDSLQDPMGFYGPENNNIATLQDRGMVFIACHDSIHAIARNLTRLDRGDVADADALAADLTNHLVSGTVLVPSVVAFLVELQRFGFTYAKGA